MNAAERARIGNRIVTYLGERLAAVFPDGIQPGDARAALNIFAAYPMEKGKPGCEARYTENKAYCDPLTAKDKAILALLIERAARRYARKEMSE